MTGSKVVLGLQWGDEGKGKAIDVLGGDMDLVVRCQGGANAGHTVVIGGQKFVLHLLPSGAFHTRMTCVIGNGVVVDPLCLQQELRDLGPAGDELRGRLLVSDRAHLLLPIHTYLDRVREELRGSAKVGTTLRGIGPCYSHKAQRCGLRCGDLADWDAFHGKVLDLVTETNRLWEPVSGQALDGEALFAEIEEPCRELAPLVGDTVARLQAAHAAGESILFEGAQGTMLDIDFGTYPFVTSSNTGVGGIVTGSGLSHKCLGEVIGILKAYTTRVGAGPFPTELGEAEGVDDLRSRGGEFGATTGRPRRCGWLDLVVGGHACRINGVDNLTLTKLDVLSGFETLRVCVAYRRDGAEHRSFPADLADLERSEPVYAELPGWRERIDDCTVYADLPAEARAYVEFIEDYTGVRVGFIGTGPDREATIVR